MAPFIYHQCFGLKLCFIVITICFGLGYGASPLYSFDSSSQHEISPMEHNIHAVNATTPIIYKDRTFYSFIISKNGLVVFTNNTAVATSFYSVDWSESHAFIDAPFIAPYYHNGQMLNIIPGYTGRVRYQALEPGSQDQTLRDMGRYCRSQVVGSTNFNPTWGIVVTWMNVTSGRTITDSNCDGTKTNPCPSNTFQLVLLTDGTQSYAILNYDKLDMQPSTYSQAGFNGGAGSGWVDVIGRSPTTTNVNRLNQYQASDVMGRYVYKISSGTIVRAGCSTDPDNDAISIYPAHAGMFGGKMLDVSGPCFTASQRIKCRFGEPSNNGPAPSTTDAVFVNSGHVRCMVPRLMVRDRITFSVSVNGGNTYPYSTIITIVFPGRMSSDEHVKLISSQTEMTWYDWSSDTLSLEWNPDLLTNNSNDRVSIRMIGYKQDSNMGYFSELAVLGSDIPVSRGSFTLNTRDHQCTGNFCFDYEVAVIEVGLQDGAVPRQYKFLSSTVVPLGWYVKNAMTSQYGESWQTKMCVKWYDQDKTDMAWLDTLLHCPCSLGQAIADFGRWQPDNGCNLYNKRDGNCFYHRTAVHCVRAVQPVNGAGNQCCYSKTGSLIYAADTFQGSTPDRSHDWGAAPYGKPGYVPSLSHWIDDVVTFYYCCLWTEYESCDHYMDQRATKDCTGYIPPVPASVYGQGHVTTFTGFTYRMIGPGDYVLLKADNTIVQGRFDKNPYRTENQKKIETTFSLTGVSVQDVGTSDRVEIELRGPEYNTEYQKINVWVNGQLIHFDEKSMAWQDFKGLAVINSDKKMKVQSNFTVLLTNGIGFQVVALANTLQLDLMVPSQTFNQVSGLFGDLAGNLTSPNGTDFDDQLRQMTASRIYNSFQLSWAVNDSVTNLFSTSQPANHTLLGPVETDPTPLPGTAGATAFCHNDPQCIFDYRHTGSEILAQATLAAAQRQTALRGNLQIVRSCGLLNVPRSTKTNYGYTIGTTTTITGCRVGDLQGTNTYTCVETSNVTQEWSPAVTASCEVSTEDAGVGLIVGVVLGCIAVVVIAVIVAVFLVMKRRRSQYWKRSGESKSPDERQTMKSSV